MTSARQSDPAAELASSTFEGDYRPAEVKLPGERAGVATLGPEVPGARNIRLESLQVD